MRRFIEMAAILLILMALGGCFPASYDTSGISEYLYQHDPNPYPCSWHHLKKDGTPQRIGLHFGVCDTQGNPLRAYGPIGIELGIIRLNIYWPPFVSFSAGFIGHRGFQSNIGFKFDPTEQDFLFSPELRFHELSPASNVNQAGS